MRLPATSSSRLLAALSRSRWMGGQHERYRRRSTSRTRPRPCAERPRRSASTPKMLWPGLASRPVKLRHGVRKARSAALPRLLRRRRSNHRRTPRELLEPGKQLRPFGADVAVELAEQQKAYAAAKSDLAEINLRIEITHGSLDEVETLTRLGKLAEIPGFPLALLRAGVDLVTAKDGGVEDAVGECLHPQRSPRRGSIGRNQPAAPVTRIEIGANHRRIEQRHSVIGDEGRQLHERVLDSELGVRLDGGDRGVDQADLAGLTGFVRRHENLPRIRRGCRVVELHVCFAFCQSDSIALARKWRC